jgi:hypothetical protein
MVGYLFCCTHCYDEIKGQELDVKISKRPIKIEEEPSDSWLKRQWGNVKKTIDENTM